MKRLLSAVLAVVMAVGMFTVAAGAAGIFDEAKTMKAMQYYNITVDNGGLKYYKIVLPKDGKLNFRGTTGNSNVCLMNPKAEMIWGESWTPWTDFEIKDLKAGTYYLRFNGGNNYTDFYYIFTPDDKPTLAIKISVKAKTELQLGSIVSDYKGSVKWTSNKKSIATVTSKGLVKTLAKGTVTIRAELDDGTFDTIKITVT